MMMAVSMALMFVFPLITERGMNPFHAVMWSVKGVLPHLPGLLGLHLLNSMIGTIGALMCFVPGFLYLPVALASTAIAFKKIYGLAERPSYRDFEERDAADVAGVARPRSQGGWTPLSASGAASQPMSPSPVPPPPVTNSPEQPPVSPQQEAEAEIVELERPATARMASRGGGFGSGAGPGEVPAPVPRMSTVVESRDNLPRPPRSGTIVEERSSLPSAAASPQRKATVVVPPDELPEAPVAGSEIPEPPAAVEVASEDLDTGPESEDVAPVSENAATELAAPGVVLPQTGPQPTLVPAAEPGKAEPDRPMTMEELGAAQTRLMDSNPFLSEDEEGS